MAKGMDGRGPLSSLWPEDSGRESTLRHTKSGFQAAKGLKVLGMEFLRKKERQSRPYPYP